MPDQQFHPSIIARAYREEYPGKFDDISDASLLDSLKELDPDTYKLVNPLLLGAEVLDQRDRELPSPPLPKLRNGKPYDPTKGPYPLPTPPPEASGLESVGMMGGRMLPMLAGAAVGSLIAPGPGTAIGAGVGAGVGELGTEAYEVGQGLPDMSGQPRTSINPLTVGFESALGLVAPEAKGATFAARAAKQALYGGMFGLGGTSGRSVIERGELPTMPEAVANTAFGAAGGMVIQGATEGLTNLYRMSRPGTHTDLPTAQQAKSYLEEIAAAQIPMETVGGIRGGVETALELGPPPPPPAGLLPPGRGDPNAIRAYPPGVNPSIELVGEGAPPASRIIGGRDIGTVQPPPSLEQAIEGSLQGEPGPPRLVRPLVLSSSDVPRGTSEPPLLTPRGREVLAGPTRQTGQYQTPSGEAAARLPSIDEPRPLDLRPYATGPNAGPRRSPREEAHGTPRKAVRMVQVGGKSKREIYNSPLTAEDPGTYPPEVRRELATMAWEFEMFPHSRESGGITNKQLDAMVRDGIARDASEATAMLRASGASAGGSIAGTPLHHTIKEATHGTFQNASNAEMLSHIRGALLEGKGNGLTDAAAQVARARLQERSAGRLSKTSRILATQGDEGDSLIGWVDRTGVRALPEQDLDPMTRTVREEETGTLLEAYRFYQSGEVKPGTEEFFIKAGEELARRGVIDSEQLDLRMEGPGGAGGPRVSDFEGGPPPRPKSLLEWEGAPGRAQRPSPSLLPDDIEERLAGPPEYSEEQPSLPGTEGVRKTENPTPSLVEEPPFSLTTPPPPKPSTVKQPSLFDRLKEEKGVLIFDIPAGDRTGIRRWLKSQEEEHGGEAWYNRAEQAIEEGDWDRAFKTAAAASVRSYAKAYSAASTPAKKAAIEAAMRGTPLQADLNTGIVAGARKQAGVGGAPPVKDFPPSRRVSQAGAARGKATLGPAGILSPGPRQRPLSVYDKEGMLAGGAAPSLRAATLDREVVRLITEGIEHPEDISTIPGNTDTYLRLFRQVGEQIYKGQNLKLLRDAGVKIPPEELAQHWNATISDAGRTLQLLSSFAQAHKEVLTEATERMSMGGALRGMVGEGGGPPTYTGARGRVASPAGQKATQEIIDQIAERTSKYQAAALANDLQKRTAVGPLRALHDASYSFMLSKLSTAERNYSVFTGRYGIDSLDHALTIPLAHVSGDTETARLSSALVRERGFLPFRRGVAVTPKSAWADDLQGIYNFTADSLDSLRPNDARRAIRLLLDVPDQAAHFLGAVTGEDLSAAYSTTPVLRLLVNPKVQRFLTMFNRAQEFSARATVFDGTVRALLRARGLDPTETLLKSTPEIVDALGGQRAFDSVMFTATAQSLEATFAGRTSKDSLPGALIRFINDAWPLKLGMPFPRFNISSAPRWIFDHGPWALVDLVRFPLDRAGITAPKGTVAGGRLYRGVRAQEILREDLPALQGKIGEAEQRQGEALQELLGTQREYQVRQRQIARLEKRVQPSLPDTQTALENAQEIQSQLARRRDTLKAAVSEHSTVVKDLQSEQKKLLDRVTDATGINAPNYAQFLARMGVGTAGMLGAAWVVRAQDGAQGTRWYEYRVDRGGGKDPIILDFRPFAPMAQYLFVADVAHDFYQYTNWDAARKQAKEEGIGGVGGPLEWSRAVWNNYEGKYTEEELGTQFAQAFLSISRAAGTTLTLVDLLTQNGWPSLEDASRAIIGTIGQFLSRFPVLGQEISDVVGQFDPEEAKVRTPPKATVEDWERPLAGPISNVPFARQLIPESISQTTGKPLAAEYPILRGLLGIGTTPRDFVVEEVRRVGVPGASVYIRETGDVGLDRLVAETYARNLKEILPEILESSEYHDLKTPARQRDYLQRYIFPALKRASLGGVREDLGEDRYQAGMVRGEAARRKARQQTLLDDLEGQTPQIPGEDQGGPPPAPTGLPPAQSPTLPPPAPGAF